MVLYLAISIPLALVLPPFAVELGIALEVALLGLAAIVAGVYIGAVGRVAREVSEYLWLLVRRDLRVALAFAMLMGLALAVLVPRIWSGLDDGGLISRPWGVIWLAVAINLFAVGLIDDALQFRADRRITIRPAEPAPSPSPAPTPLAPPDDEVAA